MQNQAPHKSYARLATEGYAAYISFCFVIGALSLFKGDPQNLIALKVIFAPFFLLANRAIPIFYSRPIVNARFNTRVIERHLQVAAVFAGFLAVVSWTAEKPLSEILTVMVSSFVGMVITQMVIQWLRVRGMQKKDI